MDKLAAAQVEILEKYASFAEDLLVEQGREYTADDVVEVASYLINNDIDMETKEAEKVAYYKEAGAVMAQGFIEQLKKQ